MIDESHQQTVASDRGVSSARGAMPTRLNDEADVARDVGTDSASNPVSAAASTQGPPSVATTEVAAITEKASLWLRRSDQLFVGVLVAVLAVLLGIQHRRLYHWGAAPVEVISQKPREYYYSLDINTASWVEWAQLDGIGEKLARRIVADREERGPFRTPADVGRVRGIGPKALEKMIPFLHGGTESQQSTRNATP